MSMVPNERDEHPDRAVPALPEGFLAPNTSLAVSLAAAEIDQQITTARAYPRSISRAVDNILTLATLDTETAEECVYALPRAGKAIKGPSVRLAEIIAGAWGNCRVGARVVHVDRFEKFIEAEGVFHDLESNTAWTSRVRRRISTSSKGGREGKIYDDDMIIVTGNAACAIAKRNAILGGVPKGVWRRAYVAVESVLVGDIKTLVARREGAMKAFAAFGVTPERVFEAIGVQGLDDIGLDHMTTLIGMHSALKSGEATVEDMFPVKLASVSGKPTNLAAKLDTLEGGPKIVHDADGVIHEGGADLVSGATASETAVGGGALADATGAGAPVVSPAANESVSSSPEVPHPTKPAPAVAAPALSPVGDSLARAMETAAERAERAIATGKGGVKMPVPKDDDDQALRIDLTRTARNDIIPKGLVALNGWLDELTDAEASVLSEELVTTWRTAAAQATKARR